MNAIIGGSPYGRNDAVVDTSRAVLLDRVDVVAVGTGRKTAFGVDVELAVGLELGGRFNRRNERSDLLYLMDADGAAQIVAELELLGLGARGVPEIWTRLAERLDQVPGLVGFIDHLTAGHDAAESGAS